MVVLQLKRIRTMESKEISLLQKNIFSYEKNNVIPKCSEPADINEIKITQLYDQWYF